MQLDNRDIDYKGLIELLSYQTNGKRWKFIRSYLNSVTDPETAEKIESFLVFLYESGALPTKENESLIILLHGIRTHASWHITLTEHIKSKSNSEVESIRYGFFSVIFFLLKLYRWKLKHVTQEIRMLKSRYPNHELILAAHSFGTYLALKFLKNNPDVKVKRILFCGSVVDNNYDFERMPNFPGAGTIANLIGTKDCYPVLAKIFSIGYGASGTFGFYRNVVMNKFLNCGHSGFFSTEIYDKYWLPFLLSGSFEEDSSKGEKLEPPYWLTIL